MTHGPGSGNLDVNVNKLAGAGSNEAALTSGDPGDETLWKNEATAIKITQPPAAFYVHAMACMNMFRVIFIGAPGRAGGLPFFTIAEELQVL